MSLDPGCGVKCSLVPRPSAYKGLGMRLVKVYVHRSKFILC